MSYISIPTSYLQGVSGRVQVRLTCAGSHALRPVGVTCRRPVCRSSRAQSKFPHSYVLQPPTLSLPSRPLATTPYN
ncbi:unnamed protein product [Danaus chrysippus]|uniref:(African queen) hypothetical protein n=1 Tax=Danaus chrysippus TaxID=151541 RepID=A0A8J2VY93_9NEOP|nr:unnamed protein product [Danaus chrysippus]